MTGLAHPLTFPPLSGGPVRARAGGRVAHCSAQPRPGPQARARKRGLCGRPARRRLQPQMQPSCKTRPSHLCPNKTDRPPGTLKTAFTPSRRLQVPPGSSPPGDPVAHASLTAPAPDGGGHVCTHSTKALPLHAARQRREPHPGERTPASVHLLRLQRTRASLVLTITSRPHGRVDMITLVTCPHTGRGSSFRCHLFAASSELGVVLLVGTVKTRGSSSSGVSWTTGHHTYDRRSICFPSCADPSRPLFSQWPPPERPEPVVTAHAS